MNPIERKRSEKTEAASSTFEFLAARYVEEHARRFKRSAAADERNLRLHILPSWAKRRYDGIYRRDVIDLCEGMVAAGTATNANRVQALISSIFSFAVDADLMLANPCLRLRKRGVERAETRVLTDSEIRVFWHGIVQPPVSPSVGAALRIALLTGVRVSEISEAELSEFQRLDEPEAAVWVIPPARSKNGRAHLVPILGLTRSIIIDAKLTGIPKRVFLFPSPVIEGSPITGHALSVAMRRFTKRLSSCAEAGETWLVDPPSPHDLRRTFATRLSSLGVPGEDVSACLNHSRRDVTGKHYDVYDRAKERRKALSVWEDLIKRIIKPDHDTTMFPIGQHLLS